MGKQRGEEKMELTLDSSVSISEAMFSNTCSSSKRGTSSALTCLAPAFIPSLLNATSFASISFSKCLACFLKSATLHITMYMKNRNTQFRSKQRQSCLTQLQIYAKRRKQYIYTSIYTYYDAYS